MGGGEIMHVIWHSFIEIPVVRLDYAAFPSICYISCLCHVYSSGTVSESWSQTQKSTKA